MNMKYKIQVRSKKLLADTLTPVNIYLKLRDVYAGSFLLESSDYHGHENSLSFICCEPMASFQLNGYDLKVKYPDGTARIDKITDGNEEITQLEELRNSLE